MKTNIFLCVILGIAISLSSCNKEETFSMQQEDLLPEVEQTGTDLDAYAHLEESVQAIIRSLDLSMKGLPANVSEITISPTGALNSNGEARLAIATGTFTSAILVKAQDLAMGQDLASGTITGTGMMGFTTLAIPAYNAASGATNRVVGFFYWGTTNQWELFHFETQAPDGTGGGGGVDPGPEPEPDPRPQNWYGSGVYAALDNVSGTFAGVTSACSYYSERADGSDRGRWFVPNLTQMEAMARGKFQGHEGLKNLGPNYNGHWPYWTTTLAPSGREDMKRLVDITYYDWNSGGSSLVGNFHYARCVTTVRPY